MNFNRNLVSTCLKCLYLPILSCGSVALSQPPDAPTKTLWDFTSYYDPSSLAHFESPLSDHDRSTIIEIIKHFTGSPSEVSISSSISGSFTIPRSKQTLVYASQYDDRRSMADGTWDFYVVFTQGHAQVIKGGVRGVRGVNFLLRGIPGSSTGLDEVLMYSGWFGMQEDIGHAFLMSFAGSQPKTVRQLGVVYESTCSSGSSSQATVASKIFLDNPETLEIHREHYVGNAEIRNFVSLVLPRKKPMKSWPLLEGLRRPTTKLSPIWSMRVSKYARIVAKPTTENPNTPPLYFDVVLGEDNVVAGENTIFGFQGDMNNTFGRSLPFILNSRGRADFGEQYDDSERYGEIDLREGNIREGRLLRFQGIGFDAMFRITEIITLS